MPDKKPIFIEDIYVLLGKKIREERLKRGLTIEELADMADIHYTFLGYIELGKKKASLETIRKLSNALEISVEQLFKFSDKSIKEIRYPVQDKTEKQLHFLVRDASPKIRKLIIDVTKKIIKSHPIYPSHK
ncbi:MAG: helix-turn-helix transcriptional regulator [Candidatus Firestonebacteria bacterium]